MAVAVTIVLFDVFGALASKTFSFNYTNLVWGSWLIYIISGFVGSKIYGLPTGILAGLTAGLAESTIGWALSSMIKPYLPFEPPQLGFIEISIIVTVVTIKGAFLGAIGALLNSLIKRFSRTSHG